MFLKATKSWLIGLSRTQLTIYCSLLNIAFTLISTPPLYLNPVYGEYNETNKRKNHVDVVKLQIDNPFDKTIFDEISPERQEAKRAFRFTVPIIAHVLGLGINQLVYLEFACGILLIIFTVIILLSILKDNILTVVWSLSFTAIPFFKLAFFDTQLFMDSFPYLFVSGLFFLNSYFFILSLSLLACFSDERSYVSILAVILFFASKYYLDKNNNDRKIAIKLTGALMLCLMLRYLLGWYFELKIPLDSTSAVGLEIFKSNILNHTFSLFTGFEFIWFILPLSIFAIYNIDKRFALFLFLVYTSFSVISLIVLDVTRSLCYLFPLIFTAIYLLNRFRQDIIKKLGIFIFVGCLFVPTTFYVSSFYVICMDFSFIKYITNKLL